MSVQRRPRTVDSLRKRLWHVEAVEPVPGDQVGGGSVDSLGAGRAPIVADSQSVAMSHCDTNCSCRLTVGRRSRSRMRPRTGSPSVRPSQLRAPMLDHRALHAPSADPYPLYSYLRENEPVHRIGESDFYLVSTWNLVNEVLMRTDEFSSISRRRWFSVRGGPFLAGLGDRSHVLCHRRTTRRRTARRCCRRSFIDSTVRRLWSDALADGASTGSTRCRSASHDRGGPLVGFSRTRRELARPGAYATTQMLDG